ncbi:MAG: hypothetical protein LBS19_09340 [Clostridiales bacterium]|jgi:hypothetical protein|nr:hypothetical protein [Clostridiales bacterium]
MAKTTKYIPVWNIVHKGVTYAPAGKGEAQRTLPGDFPEAELERLLKMGAVKKMVFDDSEDDQGQDQDLDEDTEVSLDQDLDQLTYNQLKKLAKDKGVSAPAGTTKAELVQMLTQALESERPDEPEE